MVNGLWRHLRGAARCCGAPFRMSNFLMLPIALCVFSSLVSPQSQDSKAKCLQVRFSGEVVRDERYVHALPGNLEFRLLPSPEGWSIVIGRTGDRTEDYVGIATPPYHGTNPVFIEAWHFRNADNTAPNDGQVDAPGAVRDFSFVLSRAQFKKFSDALDIWSGSAAGATEKQRAAAAKFLLEGQRRHGTLTISDMELGGLGKGNRPFFQLMKFSVDLCFPPPVEASSRNGNAAKSEPPKQNP